MKEMTWAIRFEDTEYSFNSIEESFSVINRMCELLDRYMFVSVADFFELINKPSTYIDNQRGWNSLDKIEFIKSNNGFVFKLPKTSNYIYKY